MFINGFPLQFKYEIDYDEPMSLGEFIRNLKHFYEKHKHKLEPKHDWKGNEKAKGKWPKKQGRSQDASDKESVAPHKKFNAAEK